LGAFISEERLESITSNTTRLALYRKHVQGNCAIGKALCTMLESTGLAVKLRIVMEIGRYEFLASE
jgi:hypothetical protein